MSEKINPEQWKPVEENVEKAEKAKRRAFQASRELASSSGATKRERESLEYKYKPKASRVEQKASERESSFEEEVERILGEAGSLERLFAGFQFKNLKQALREERVVEDGKAKLLTEETEILKNTKDAPSGSEQEALAEIRKELSNSDQLREKIHQSSPEAYFGIHLKELKGYKKELENGRIVETPYVKNVAEDAAAHIKAGKPVMLYGHLGTGKSELAMHIAKNYIGQNALVVSGSKYTALAELYGHQTLAVDKETGSTVSEFFLGPVYRAMEEGRPVIIDEVNAIPHEVLISLNHILTRQPGDAVNVQQDSGKMVTVKEGFGILMTGNLNQGQEKYVDRQEMDPAFLSRLYKIEYDYLPQKTEG